jgi:hypothetical protein
LIILETDQLGHHMVATTYPNIGQHNMRQSSPLRNTSKGRLVYEGFCIGSRIIGAYGSATGNSDAAYRSGSTSTNDMPT